MLSIYLLTSLVITEVKHWDSFQLLTIQLHKNAINLQIFNQVRNWHGCLGIICCKQWQVKRFSCASMMTYPNGCSLTEMRFELLVSNKNEHHWNICVFLLLRSKLNDNCNLLWRTHVIICACLLCWAISYWCKTQMVKVFQLNCMLFCHAFIAIIIHRNCTHNVFS